MTDIPTDPAKFKVWADQACREWPGELQALAYKAWLAMRGTPVEPDSHERFLKFYAKEMTHRAATRNKGAA